MNKRKKSNKNTKNKVAATFLVFFVITISIGIVTGIRYQKNIQNDGDKTYETVAESVYDSVEWLIAGPVDTAKVMSSDKSLISLLDSEDRMSDAEMVKKMTEYLSSAAKEMGVEYAYCTSENTKKYFSTNGLESVINPNNNEHDEWYPRFINSGKEYNVSIDTDQINDGTWTVFVDARIEDENGKLLGVCAVANPIKELQKILTEYESNYDVKVHFVDKNGVVKIDTDSVNLESVDVSGVQYGSSDTNNEAYSYKAADGSRVVMKYVDKLDLYLVVRSNKK